MPIEEDFRPALPQPIEIEVAPEPTPIPPPTEKNKENVSKPVPGKNHSFKGYFLKYLKTFSENYTMHCSQ